MCKFFLKADPRWDGSLKVVEYYEFKFGGQKLDVNGMLVDANVISDIVDDGIRKTHAKEYGVFSALVAADKEHFHELACQSPGEFIDVVELSKPEPVMEETPLELLIDESVKAQDTLQKELVTTPEAVALESTEPVKTEE